jgi:hypothetical protein
LDLTAAIDFFASPDSAMVVSSKERGMRCRIKDVIRQQKKSHLEVGEHFDAQRLNGLASKPNERRTGLHRQIENQFVGSGGHSVFWHTRL